VERRFDGVGVKLKIPQALQDLADVSDVFFLVSGINEDVVQVDHYEVVDHIRKDVVHEALESGGGVS
jgi:hypothetical protein